MHFRTHHSSILCRAVASRVLYCTFFGWQLCTASAAAQATFKDTAFLQDYHIAYPLGKDPVENDARSIAVTKAGEVWVATGAGVLVKNKNESDWHSPFGLSERGPAYAVLSTAEGTTWMGTWNGVYTYKDKQLKKISGIAVPISVLCEGTDGIYAGGPSGIWRCTGNTAAKKNFPVARSLKKMISDRNGGIWIASDVGLYHCNATTSNHYVDTTYLVSAYAKGLAFAPNNQLWVGGLGGVTILDGSRKIRSLTPANGCPSRYVNCISRDEAGTMWVGTDVGVVRFSNDGGRSLRFSRRWLLDDRVRDIAFDSDGNAWIATANGVSAIMKRKMTLEGKQDYFYDVLMKRHIREPWIAGQCHLNVPGDVNSWQAEDDDNDGEYTGNYLAMESFRYATLKSADAKEKAKKAFNFLKLLEEVTGGDGYFARTIVPLDWKGRVHDSNRQYTNHQLAEELVKEPRFKPVEQRWRKSRDGKWLWKGDTSSDEWCGHMMGYFFYYELVADDAEKQVVGKHVARLLDHLVNHNFAMMDVDGKPTRWSVWSPSSLNNDPEWLPDQCQNSMELLAFLKLGYYMTGDHKYQEHYLRLINEAHYLDNMKRVTKQNPAWFIYFDVTMQAYLYPIFLHCEKDPKLLDFYKQHLEDWMVRRKGDNNPLLNFLYCYANGKKAELPASINFLTDTPLDLVDWHIDHTLREDTRLVNEPVLEDVQVNELPPASIRQVVRWDKNPWTAVGGSPDVEREPVFWLLPYWMGRYLGMIQ